MKILFTSIQDLERDVNGVACHARDLKKSLESMGHSVKLITPYHERSLWSPWHSRLRRLLYWTKRKTGFSSVYLLVLKLIAFEIYQKVKKNIADCHIINAHDVITAGAALKVADGKVPVILTCHFWTEPWQEFIDGGFVREGSISHRIMRNSFRKILEKDELNFICVSERNLGLLGSLTSKTITDRAKIIYLGVESLPEKDTDRLVPPNTDFIINVGKLDRRKNQRLLVEISLELKKLDKKYLFVSVGPEDASEKAFLEAKVREEGLTDRFYLLGLQDRLTVFALMKRAVLYFHTSLEESFGITLIEAMSVGTPVVCMEYEAAHEILPGIPEAIMKKDASPQSIAQRLLAFLENRANLADLASRERAVFEERFTLKRMTDSFVSFYKELT